MKKFILNTCLFVVPFVALYGFNLIIYDQRGAEGDLARMGYFYTNVSPSSSINQRFNLPQLYTLLSEINLDSPQIKTDVMTIGDSFSEQGALGYKNFLADLGVSVVHVDREISGGNPIQTLVSLINSGLFDKLKPKYVVLQSIERDFNSRTGGIDFNAQIPTNFYKPQHSSSDTVAAHNPAKNLQFFSDATLKMPLNNFLYLFIAKPPTSNTYKVKTIDSGLFSNNPDHLLFYKNDLRKLDAKNDSSRTINSIKVLNQVNELLASKNIGLIVLVSPDKYDVYYPYIENKDSYREPTFFATYENAEKKYHNIDSYSILSSKLKEEKDVYYYDDTHWSPKGAQIIAQEIYDVMTQ